MAIKNINEIRSTDYVKNDQTFVSNTLDALANAGQRFGIPGDGLIKDTLDIQDIFSGIKINNAVERISYSYLQCDVKFEIIEPTDYSYVNVNIINNYKNGPLSVAQSEWTSSEICQYNILSPNITNTLPSDINTKYSIKYSNNDAKEAFNKRYYDYTQSQNINVNISYTENNYSYIYSVIKSNTISYVSENVNNETFAIQQVQIVNDNKTINYLKLKEVDHSYGLKYYLNDSASYFYFKHETTSDSIKLQNDCSSLSDGDYKITKDEISNIFTNVYYNKSLIDAVESYNSNKVTYDLPRSIFDNFILRLATEYQAEQLGNNTFTCYFGSDYSFPIVRNSNDPDIIYNTEDITVEYCKGEIEKTIEEHILDKSKYTDVNKYVLVDWRNDKTQSIKKADAYDKYAIFNIVNNINSDGIVDLFYPIKVFNTLTMPYLSEDNYWNINGYQTSIKATGKEAVQPSTIIIQKLIDDKYPKVVSYLHNDKLNDDNLNDGNKKYIVSKKIKVSLPSVLDNLQNSYGDIDTPILNLKNLKNVSELEDFVKSSMLISIVQVNNNVTTEKPTETPSTEPSTESIEKQSETPSTEPTDKPSEQPTEKPTIQPDSSPKLEELIPGGFVMTFWVYDENIDDFNCISVKENDNYIALDITKLANFNSIVRNSLNNINEEPDRFYHSQLVFDTIERELKQIREHKNNTVLTNPVDGKNYYLHNADIYPLIHNTLSYIRNNDSESFNQGLLPIKVNNDEYRNDTILNVGFYNRIETELSNNKIVDLSMSLSDKYETSFMSYLNNKTPVGYQCYYNTSNANDTDSSLQSKDYIPDGIYSKVQNDSTKLSVLYTPILDLSSVLINNDNFINRLGILSFDTPDKTNKSTTYYSYIGTTYDGDNKSHLVIGTSTRNVNLNRHVINPARTNNFLEQSDIDINFNNFNLNVTTSYNNSKYNYRECETLVHLNNYNGFENTYTSIINVLFDASTIANDVTQFQSNNNYIGYIKTTKLTSTPYVIFGDNDKYISYVISLNKCISKHIENPNIKQDTFVDFIEVEKDIFDNDKARHKILPINILYKIENNELKIIGANLSSDIY